MPGRSAEVVSWLILTCFLTVDRKNNLFLTVDGLIFCPFDG